MRSSTWQRGRQSVEESLNMRDEDCSCEERAKRCPHCLTLAPQKNNKKDSPVFPFRTPITSCPGPFSVNGVPLKRVNAAYVIATVTKVSLPKLPMDIDDSFFAKEEADEPAGEDKFFAQTKKATETSEERKAAQKKFDTAIVGALKDDKLKGYLKATFTLQKGDKPHNMVF